MIRTKDHYDDDLYPFFDKCTHTSCLGNEMYEIRINAFHLEGFRNVWILAFMETWVPD